MHLFPTDLHSEPFLRFIPHCVEMKLQILIVLVFWQISSFRISILLLYFFVYWEVLIPLKFVHLLSTYAHTHNILFNHGVSWYEGFLPIKEKNLQTMENPWSAQYLLRPIMTHKRRFKHLLKITIRRKIRIRICTHANKLIRTRLVYCNRLLQQYWQSN